MREIKFRVRNTTTEKIAGYECLFPRDTKNSIYEWASSVNGQDWQPGIMRLPRFFVYLREQYAGIKDKNEKEIYEADIVRIFEGTKNERIDEVIFSEGFFTKKGSPGSSLNYHQNIEIIGNIYENPELLKQYANN